MNTGVLRGPTGPGVLRVVLVAAGLALAGPAAAQDVTIDADTVDVAGATSQGGPWTVTGSLGQLQSVGTSVGATYEVEGGLWHRGLWTEPGDDDDGAPDDDDAAPDDDDGAPDDDDGADDDDVTTDDDDLVADDDDSASTPVTGGCENCSLSSAEAGTGVLVLLPILFLLRRESRGTR